MSFLTTELRLTGRSGIWLSLVFAGMLSACGQNEPASTEPAAPVAPVPSRDATGEGGTPAGEPSFGIVGGTTIPAGDPVAATTVTLLFELFPDPTHYTYYTCSGTLIDQQFVLTAAHCPDNSAGYYAVKVFVLFAQNVDYNGFIQANDNNGTVYRQAVSWVGDPAYDAVNARNDVGLVRFSGGIPAGYTTAPLASSVPYTGETLQLAGYGFTGWNSNNAGTLREVNSVVSLVNTGDGHFELQSSGQTSCSGDSGGPVYISKGPAYAQVGVISYTNDQCASWAGAMLVSNYIPWIQSQGATPKIVDLAPIAYLDGLNNNTAVSGWAFDPDTSASINVAVYYDNNTYLGTYPANGSRPDVNTAYGIGGAHGYSVPIPPSLVGHIFHVYAIDATNPGLSTEATTWATGLTYIADDQYPFDLGGGHGWEVYATFSDGSSSNVSVQAGWSSSNPGVASIAACPPGTYSPCVMVTSNAYGSAVITTSYGGKSISLPMTVTSPYAVPTGLTAAYQSTTQEELVWQSNSAGQAGFYFEFSPDQVNWIAAYSPNSGNPSSYDTWQPLSALYTCAVGRACYARVATYTGTPGTGSLQLSGWSNTAAFIRQH